MGVGLVALVRADAGAEEGGEILVHDDGLERSDHTSPGRLKNVFIIPSWVHLLHSGRLNTWVSVLVSYPASILILVS